MYKKPILLCVNVWTIVILCTVGGPSPEWTQIQTFPQGLIETWIWKGKKRKGWADFLFQSLFLFAAWRTAGSLFLLYLSLFWRRKSYRKAVLIRNYVVAVLSDRWVRERYSPRWAPKGDRNHDIPAAFEKSLPAQKARFNLSTPIHKSTLAAWALNVSNCSAPGSWAQPSWEILAKRGSKSCLKAAELWAPLALF